MHTYPFATLAGISLLASACGGQVSLGTLNDDAGTPITQVQSPVVCPNESTLVRTVFDSKAVAGGQSQIVDFASDGVSLYVAAPVTANYQAGGIWKITGTTTTKLIDTSPQVVRSISLTRDSVLFKQTSNDGNSDCLAEVPKSGLGGASNCNDLQNTSARARAEAYAGSSTRKDYVYTTYSDNFVTVSAAVGDSQFPPINKVMVLPGVRLAVRQVLFGGNVVLAAYNASATDIVPVGFQQNTFQLLRAQPTSSTGYEAVTNVITTESKFAADDRYAYVMLKEDSKTELGGALMRFPLDSTRLNGERIAYIGGAYEDFVNIDVDEKYLYVERSPAYVTSIIITQVSKQSGQSTDIKTIPNVNLGFYPERRKFTTDACNFYWRDGDKIYSQSKASLAPN